jgi:uroporphyrinogen III methyltransferase/synthase
MSKDKKGFCYLVGAGPGDTGLLTLRGLEVLQTADVVVYDSLVNIELLRFTPEKCEHIDVGKRAGRHTMSQEEINQTLVEQVREGKQVVRLKGGDPFVFARGGEEVEAVDQAGFAFEVIPGISSGMAVPAYAGVPLTHRDCASNVTFVTGHEQESELGRVNWGALAEAGGTLVIFMGSRMLARIVTRLTDGGMSPETPAIFIQWGTTSQQRSVHGSVAELPALVEKAGLGSPAIIVIGSTVELREKLAWYEARPLFGKQVAITRARGQSGKLNRLFRQAGAAVLEIPAIRIEFPDASWEGLSRVGEADWILFTSPNGVEGFFQAYLRDHDIRDLAGVKFACVGPSTAEALEAYHLPVDFMPTSYRVASLLKQWPEPAEGRTLLYACGNLAATELEEGFRHRGAQVHRTEVYRTIEAIDWDDPACRQFRESGADWVVFCSPSAVRSFSEHRERWPRDGVRYASIGPATSEALQASGYPVDAEPEVSTLETLVARVVELTSGG